MRRRPLLLALLLLSACHEKRQSFDDRYNATSSDIENRAAALDRQASGADSENNISQGR